MNDKIYLDFKTKQVGHGLDTLFCNWEGAKSESVLILSPHDDDAILGTGNLIQACKAEGVRVDIAILCDGSAGYTDAALKDTIVALRKQETRKAYAVVGLAESQLHFFDYPDFSLPAYLGWKLPGGSKGCFEPLIKLMRSLRVTRLFFTKGNGEHPDHDAAFFAGCFYGVQSGDSVCVDLGEPSVIKSFHTYAVWSDFSQEGEDPSNQVRRGICVPKAAEEELIKAATQFSSQDAIIQQLVQKREGRKTSYGYLEAYGDVVCRPPLDYKPYAAKAEAILSGKCN